jgi:hypothetical protein
MVFLLACMACVHARGGITLAANTCRCGEESSCDRRATRTQRASGPHARSSATHQRATTACMNRSLPAMLPRVIAARGTGAR